MSIHFRLTSFCRLAAAACAAMLVGPAAVRAAGRLEVDSSGAARMTMGRVATGGGGGLIVTFREPVTGAQAQKRLAGLGSLGELVPEIGVWSLVPTSPATARAATLGREGVARAEWAMSRRLADLPVRKPAWPATTPQIAVTEPVDRYYADASANGQWSMHTGLWNIGLTAYAERPIIAILDTGIAVDHEEWRTPGLLVSPFSTIRNTPSADDISTRGHGTHVAGIAAAPADGVGVVGVAPANLLPTMPGARVMPVQITDRRGNSTDITMMAGIRWAVGHGAKVINLSSGGPGYNQAYQDTVNWAFKRGALIVASVGNEGQDNNPVNFPAGYDHVLGVGAVCDAEVSLPDCPEPFGRATFSNVNYSVDVLAPGTGILSTVPIRVVENLRAPGYGYIEGTSMAAPYVAGTAALVFASHPGITPYQVTRIIESTASRAAAGLGRTSASGWGNVNPAAAVAAVAPEDDLTEINDDVKFLPTVSTISLVKQRVQTFTARADYNDDQFDTYGVYLAKGKRVRVTITGTSGRLGVVAYRPGSTVSPRVMSDRQILLRELGETRRTTPGRRAFVFTAKQTGRHFLWVVALSGGGEYTLKVEKLN